MVSSSPGLFAAAHVLHRLLAPRHPPCALSLLIMKNTISCRYGVFKVRAGGMPTDENAGLGAGLSKLNSVDVEVDILLGDPVYRTRYAPDGALRTSTGREPPE